MTKVGGTGIAKFSQAQDIEVRDCLLPAVTGRGSHVTDVLLDAVGAATCLAVALAVARRRAPAATTAGDGP